MTILGKILGAVFGSLVAGPLGFILGIVVGHFFDKGLALNDMNSPQVALAKKIFFKTTFMMMGHIAKADGRVTEREIQAARNAMAKLQLSATQKQLAIQFFNEGKSAQFDARSALNTFVEHCGRHPQLVQLFVEAQLQAAFADGLDSHKRALLEQLCDRLNVPRFLLDQMSAFHNYQSHSHSHSQSWAPKQAQQDELTNAYALLGVSNKDTTPHIKKAYRQLMSQHHPDKLVSKGLPDEMIRMATEKTQRIQKAYEMICKERGV